MGAVQPWQTIQSTVIVADRWLHLNAQTCRLADGTLIEPYYVIRDPDWVQVFAQTSDGRVLLVRQYRHAAGVTCMELPGGAAEPNESALDAARRELLEETGYAASEWIPICRMFTDPARLTNSLHTFLALNAERVAAQKLDHGEELEVEQASIAEIESMIERGEFASVMHIASVRQVQAYLAQKTPRA